MSGPDLLDARLGAVPEDAPAGERRLRVPLEALGAAAAALAEQGARFVTLHALERPGRTLVAAFAHRGSLVSLRAELGDGPGYPSLAAACPACRIDERELHDVHGLLPREEVGPEPLLHPDPDALPRRVSGPETFVIPYGPVRSGVFEAVQHVVETGGEDVLHMQVRPMFKRRELERRFSGLDLEQGGFLAERVAGIACVAHAIAYAEAVERATGADVPPAARLWRVVHAELERIANHLDVAARLAEDAALAVGTARFTILKEQVMRLRASLCGSRFGRGVVVPGGVRGEQLLAPKALGEALTGFERDLARDRRLLLGTTSFADRLIGTGRLDWETVHALAGVGPVARAAGLSTDVRFERPYAAYDRLGWEVVTHETGDAMARLEVRLGEIAESLHLIRQAIDRIVRAPAELRAGLPGRSGAAFGWSEAPQGELVYWVAVEGATVDAARIASPSLRNWPLFAETFRGDVLTDFSFSEHSFGLTPAGADR